MFRYVSSLTEEFAAKQAHYYYYLINSTWRELESHIVDLDQAETILPLARKSLKNLEDQQDDEVCLIQGCLVTKEKKLEEAKKHLFSEKTLAFINGGFSVRQDWEQAVKSYIALVNEQEKLEAYQALGEVYKKKQQFMNAYEAFFEAYKLLPQSSDKTHHNALFMECANIFQISKEKLDFTWKSIDRQPEFEKLGPYRFLGYRFYSELSQHGLEGYDEMASNYLKEAITEGYTPALREIMRQFFEHLLRRPSFWKIW